MISTKLTVPIHNINERLNFSTLWHLQHQLVYGLRKLGNIKFPSGQPRQLHPIKRGCYILSNEAFTFFSIKEWKDPEEIGGYYKITVTEITEMEQRTEEKMEGQEIEERDLQ